MLTTVLIALTGIAAQANAHFTTAHLLVNGTDTGLWKHVLKVAAPDDLYGGYDPAGMITPLYSDHFLNTSNITCGRAAFKMLGQTEIADIVAGEEIGFRTLNEKDVRPGWGIGYFFHPGPAQVWLSRAPNDDLKSYRGEGDWFKVAYAGPKNDTDWPLWSRWSENQKVQTDYNFTLPRTTPPGAYLLRFEYIYPNSYSAGFVQFFVNCALVNIHAPDASVKPGTPTGFVKFPGAYEPDDIGLLLPFTQDVEMGLPIEQLRLTEYKAPGPAVWQG
ncbi:hypothetical protein N0V90_003526 [Kalmusia sp. IMI 367209]|nr:hypothetical protein N0V90_003526 [Kalmusia sp. IMI 367209]